MVGRKSSNEIRPIDQLRAKYDRDVQKALEGYARGIAARKAALDTALRVDSELGPLVLKKKIELDGEMERFREDVAAAKRDFNARLDEAEARTSR